MKRTVWALVLLLALTAQARAEIAIANSVEWLTCQADVIVIGKIVKIDVVKGPGSVKYEESRVRVEGVLKGDVKAKEIGFTLRTLSGSPSAKAFMNSKAEVLLFLSKSKNHGSEKRLDGKYVPTSMGYPFSIINLSKPSQDLYSKEMRILTGKKQILKAVRQWAMFRDAKSLWSEVPFDSPIFQKLWSGSSVYLVVPAEEKHRIEFMKMAKSPNVYQRAKAAGELGKFPGKETEKMLRSLLKDDAEIQWHYAADIIERVEFNVRTAAYNSLKSLGKPVPDIELQRKPTEKERIELRQSYWKKSFGEALTGGWEVASVDDGPTRRVEGRDFTVVVVTCKNKQSGCKLTLIPKQGWQEKDFPTAKKLGINGPNSQGGRHFFLEGELPKQAKEKLVQYFGLK